MAEMKKRPFTGSAADCRELVAAINKGVDVEKCGFELSPIMKQAYMRDLEFLKEERKTDPSACVTYKSSYIE